MATHSHVRAGCGEGHSIRRLAGALDSIQQPGPAFNFAAAAAVSDGADWVVAVRPRNTLITHLGTRPRNTLITLGEIIIE